MQHAFTLFPWDKPFLPEVIKYICDVSHNDLSRVSIIMPHSRPRRYLNDLLYAKLPRPCFLPNMLTVTEMVQLFQNVQESLVDRHNLREATELDAVYLLFKSISKMQHDNATFNAFSRLDFAQFLPWGLRLFTLFEECMQQLAPIQNIAHTEEEVSPLAAELLGALGDIFAYYLATLEQEGFTTKALSSMRTVQALQENPLLIPDLLQSKSERNQHVFLIGFNVLTECDEQLLKALWQDGAHVCIYSDPTLVSAEKNDNAHFSCQDHALWLRRWNAQCVLAAQPSGNAAQLHFVAAYDVHSQLLALQGNLQEKHRPSANNAQDNEYMETPSSAVVLTSPDLLIPTLHHLPPNVDFNVSMGYPLEKSSLFAFIDILLRLQEGVRLQEEVRMEDARPQAQSMESETAKIAESENHTSEQRHYYWRELLYALRHPYVQALRFSVTGGTETLHPNAQVSVPIHSLEADITCLEKILRSGKRFISIEELLQSWQLHPSYVAESTPFLHSLLTCIVHNFAKAKSAHELGAALYDLCQLLLRHCTDFLDRHDIDAESMYRLIHKVIPQLQDSCLAHMPLPPAALFALCRQFIGKERVAFEADPITGLQIIGMLETRLLHFENIFILDAIDSALPGFKPTDPLLPESLRPVFGLPGLQERERVMAFTLHCLLCSAKNVYFYWQEGMPGSELLDNKKARSRFVDIYLWEEECRQSRIIEKDTAPLHTVPCPLYPLEFKDQTMQVTPEMRAKITSMLEYGISPSKLNTYLSCPQRFFWQYVFGFGTLEEVNEGDDFTGVGELVHRALHKAFSVQLEQQGSQKIEFNETTLRNLLDIFQQQFSLSYLQNSLSPQNKTYLRMVAPLRLENFLQAQQRQIPCGYTHIEHMERVFSAPISGYYGETFSIRGQVDRVDRRTAHECNKVAYEGLVILDYKTGTNVNISGKNAFLDMSLFDQINSWTPSDSAQDLADSHELLTKVSEAFPSLQLPCYLYLCQHQCGETAEVLDAAFVSLANSGEELYFLKNVEYADRAIIINERIVEVLTFVVRHLQYTKTVLPRRSTACKHCPYTLLCQKTL